MLLKSLTFEQKDAGWKVEDLQLLPVNLLVGGSGVGKTLALDSIWKLHWIAAGVIATTLGVRFRAVFVHGGVEYSWELDSDRTEKVIGVANLELADAVLSESLVSSAEGELFRREGDQVVLRGQAFPAVSRARSLLPTIAAKPLPDVAAALFSQMLRLYEPREDVSLPGTAVNGQLARDFHGQVDVGGEWLVRGYLLQKNEPAVFDDLKARFIELFPTVDDVRFVLQPEPSGNVRVQVEVNEEGVNRAITGWDLSAGMLRALAMMVELTAAPEGTIVLIDELENSFGVNCLVPLTEFILSRTQGIQYVVTSHHPYIIDRIPPSSWQVMRRRGTIIRGLPGSQIRALQGASAQDAFTRLINSPEFEQGAS